MTVRSINATIEFLQAAFPAFGIRHEGRDADGSRWVHVGTDDSYVMLTEASAKPPERWEPYAGRPGVNHLGFEVPDAEALRARMQAAGFENSTVPNHHPHRKRVYFIDPDGNDWEFVQYLSDNPRERNDYELPN